MKLSDYVATFLAKHTGHAFVGNGGCVVHILDSLDRNKSITVVPCENEQGAAIAAEAYFRVSNKIGLAIATSGPGMINLMQGMACAYFDSIPVLFISGASPTGHLRGKRKVRQLGFQEMDVVGIVKPLTKYAVLLDDPQNIRFELEKLIYYAREGRGGPVLLDLPDDIQRAEINPKELRPFVAPAKKNVFLEQSQLDRLHKLILNSKKPVVVVGSGVKLAGAEKEMRRFLKQTALPYATTWSTIDMFNDDEKGLIGNFGVSANRAGNIIIQQSDLIISLGSRLDTHETGSNPAHFAPFAKKIVVDIDHSELNKNNGLVIDIKINADVRDVLKQLNKIKFNSNDFQSWQDKILAIKKIYPICLPEYYKQPEKVNPYVFMNELSQVTDEGDVIITDAGGTLTWTMQAYKVQKRQLLFSAFNHSPMGYALPASIGAQYAAPQNRIVCITGDGGMQMNIQELETVVHHNLPIKIFLINNGEYGIIKQTQDTWLNSHYVASDPDSGVGFPDFEKIAKAYGLTVFQINCHKNLKGNIKKVLQAKGSVLCIVEVKHGEKIVPKLEFGNSLENLSPLLDRDILEKHMS